MTEIPAPITPHLEPAAKELAEATDPHPRIYEVPPEQGRQILLDLQSGEGVPRPDVDEQWVDVDAGQWGTVPTRIIRPEGVTGPRMLVHSESGWHRRGSGDPQPQPTHPSRKPTAHGGRP